MKLDLLDLTLLVAMAGSGLTVIGIMVVGLAYAFGWRPTCSWM